MRHDTAWLSTLLLLRLSYGSCTETHANLEGGLDLQQQPTRQLQQEASTSPSGHIGGHQCDHYLYSLSPAQYSANEAVRERCGAWCASRGQQRDDCLARCAAHEEALHRQHLAALPASLQEDHRNMVFVGWFAVGNKGAEGFDTHQFIKPDMNFAKALQRSHPGCRIVITTDQATQLEVAEGVEIFRFTIDKEKFGRNAYGNYYQYQAQAAFLRSLAGADKNVVFIDMDILVIESIAEVFCHSFDYALTISDSIDQPINLGFQFVKAGHHDAAIQFLEDLIRDYPFDQPQSFTAGQKAIADFLALSYQEAVVREIQDSSIKHNQECRHMRGKYTVCFFPCLKYNYWEFCLEHHQPQPLAWDDAAAMQRHAIKAFHFIAWRKPGLDVVFEAFMRGGAEAARQAFAALPHSEQEYQQRGLRTGHS